MSVVLPRSHPTGGALRSPKELSVAVKHETVVQKNCREASTLPGDQIRGDIERSPRMSDSTYAHAYLQGGGR